MLGANDFLAGWVFSAPLNMTAVLNKDCRTKEHTGCVWDSLVSQGMSWPSVCTWKKTLPLPNWRCFPIHRVPVKDANVRAARGGNQPSRAKGSHIHPNGNIRSFCEGGWGNILRGFCLYLWFYLFILKDLVRPNPLTPARELFLCFTLENKWQ